MRYKLKKHPEDSAMILATHNFNELMYFAFSVHEDSLGNKINDAFDGLDDDGFVEVEMMLVEDKD